MKRKSKRRDPAEAESARVLPLTSPAPAGEPPAGEAAGCLLRAWERGWLPAVLLVLAIILAYQPVWHAGFIWDDDDYVTNNPLLTAPDGLRRIWFSLDSPSQYFPLVYTTFRFEHALWGFNASGYHWINLLLHAANAVLLWRLLKRLAVPGAWLAAAVFALHPVNVESVAWITERKNVLCLCFSLLTVRAWVEFIWQGSWRWYGLALALYPWALFSKTTACTLPAALLLVLWLKHKPVTWRRVAEVVPFVLMGVGMGLLTVWWERFHNGTQGAQFSMSLPERLQVAGHAVWFYLGKLVWPVNLAFSYARWSLQAGQYGWWVLLAGLGWLAWYARRWVGRSAEVALVFYVATLSPLLGFIMLYTFRYSYVADHYQYVAAIGPLTLAAAGLTVWLGRAGRGRWLLPGTGAVVLLALGMLTWRQSTSYRDIQTLWEATLAHNPDSCLAHNNLGHVLIGQGRRAEAMAHFRRALEIQPDFSEAHVSLAAALLKQGQVDEAMASARKGVALSPDNPGFRAVLGDALLQKGRLDEAIAEFQEVLKLEPESARAWYDAGRALLEKGRLDEAGMYLDTALKFDPKLAGAHNSLGKALLQKGLTDAAILQFQKAIELDPMDAVPHGNLGIIYFRAGRPDEAIAQFQKSLELDSNSAQMHNNLGTALMQKGRVDEAVAQFVKALEIDPGQARALDNLGHLAWLLATSPDASKRNGARALELARQADQFAGGKNPAILSALAAAYAETGKFPEAVASAQHALQLANAQTNTPLADALQTQLKSYEAGQPFRDTAPTPVPVRR